MVEMSEESPIEVVTMADNRPHLKCSSSVTNDNSTPTKFGPIGFPPTFNKAGPMGYMERIVEWFRRNEEYQNKVKERRAAIEKIRTGGQENNGSGDHSAVPSNEDHNNEFMAK
ncbi:hypothetical protein OSTOST_07406 [Ostertagia ostertagi]